MGQPDNIEQLGLMHQLALNMFHLLYLPPIHASTEPTVAPDMIIRIGILYVQANFGPSDVSNNSITSIANAHRAAVEVVVPEQIDD